jgi:prophage tail gpP-like protein
MSAEKIAAAAIKIGNEVYTGMTHFAVMRRIVMMPDVASGTVAQMILDGMDGFVTDAGRFVDRAEAFRIAAQARQMSDHEYADPEKNKAFYGTEEPSLDSGLIEHYAAFIRKPSYLS